MPPEPPSPEELVRLGDPEELLPGEEPASVYLEDAVHWVRVYSELLALKLALLTRSGQVLAGLSDDAVSEADVDQRLLRSQAERYARRHEYWTQRIKQLAAAADGEPRHAPAGEGPHG
jgi:hypothetical protein